MKFAGNYSAKIVKTEETNKRCQNREKRRITVTVRNPTQKPWKNIDSSKAAQTWSHSLLRKPRVARYRPKGLEESRSSQQQREALLLLEPNVGS